MKKWLVTGLLLALLMAALPLAALGADSGTAVLPETLKTVEAGAFAGDKKLSTVMIPKTVTRIESRAFADCAGLRQVYFGKCEAVDIAPDAFAGCGDIHFYAFPNTAGELFAVSHGYQCDLLEEGGAFLEQALQLVTAHGGTTSILQSADFSAMRLIVRMSGSRLPDISAYKPVKILRKAEGIFFVQFNAVQDAMDCYSRLKQLQKADSGIVFVEPDACVEVIDDVEAAGNVDASAWDNDDPMGFDVYAPYVKDNGTGKVTIAVIDSGVKKLSAYSGMLRSDGISLVSDGKDWSNDNLIHGSMIAGIIRDCIGSNRVEILPVRVAADSSVADCSMIALGIDYAVERGADIINLSMNFDESEYVRYALEKAMNAGVCVVVAAGNSHRNIEKVFPANVPGVIAVSGIDSAYTLSASSNYGENIAYCAPDTNVVCSAYPSMSRKGTSFAAPMVASALALAKLDVTHSEADLSTVCRKLDSAVNGVNNYGYGLMQLDQLVTDGYAIVYDANGGEDAPEAQLKTPGVSIRLSKSTPKRFYSVTLNDGMGETSAMRVAAPFLNWNTSANGSGTDYAPGATYNRDAPLRLYAQWDGGALTELPAITREGYAFEGWHTAATGGNPVDSETIISRDITLYAHWRKVDTYIVAYDANGGTGAPESQTKTEGVALTLSADVPARIHTVTLDFGTGETQTREVPAAFKCWNTAADGKGTDYAPGAAYTADAAVTLYAIWTYGKMGELPAPTRDGYDFMGWFTTDSGEGKVTQDDVVTADITIYANFCPAKLPAESPHDEQGLIRDSWDEILAAIDRGTAARRYEIGDYKPLTLQGIGTVNMQLVGFNLDTRADGQGKAATTWIAKELLPETRRWNPEYVKGQEGTGTIGGWEKCELRAYLYDTVLPAIPSTLRSRLVRVRKDQRAYDTSNKAYKQSTEDAVWIPNGNELFGEDSLYHDMFGDENAKKVKTLDDSPTWWWLRTAEDNDYAYCVTTDGSYFESLVFGRSGVVLGFCLDSRPDTVIQTDEISDSWDKILAAIDDGTAEQRYAVGAWKPLTLQGIGTVNMQLVGFNLDERADGQGKAATTWIAKELLPEERRWNPEYVEGQEGTGTIGGWEKSELRAYLNDAVLPAIPSVVRNRLVRVKKNQRAYADWFFDYTQTTEDTVWIPDISELFGGDSLYYSMFGNEDAKRVKKRNGMVVMWWLRSAYASGYAYDVSWDGSGANYSGVDIIHGGVALGFCL